MVAPDPAACVVCRTTADDIPLIPLEYRGEELRICPMHLPILIHDPTRLAGVLPGAEGMRPADHHD